MKVSNYLTAYVVTDKSRDYSKKPTVLMVEDAGEYRNCVIILLGEHKVMVEADELLKAIKNATHN